MAEEFSLFMGPVPEIPQKQKKQTLEGSQPVTWWQEREVNN